MWIVHQRVRTGLPALGGGLGVALTGEYGGVAPTNREIAVENCEVYTYTGDKLTECYVYGDSMSLFDQLTRDRG